MPNNTIKTSKKEDLKEKREAIKMD